MAIPQHSIIEQNSFHSNYSGNQATRHTLCPQEYPFRPFKHKPAENEHRERRGLPQMPQIGANIKT
jgi:hypothetical protein